MGSNLMFVCQGLQRAERTFFRKDDSLWLRCQPLLSPTLLSQTPGHWAPVCCRERVCSCDPIAPCLFQGSQGPLCARLETYTHAHTGTLPCLKSFWGINIKSGIQPVFFFFLFFTMDLYLLLFFEVSCCSSIGYRKPFLMSFLFFPKGADSLYRNSFSFSDEKLNSPTDSTPALLSPTAAPRKGELLSWSRVFGFPIPFPFSLSFPFPLFLTNLSQMCKQIDNTSVLVQYSVKCNLLFLRILISLKMKSESWRVWGAGRGQETKFTGKKKACGLQSLLSLMWCCQDYAR